MKTIEINLYKFSELSKDAKEKAVNELSCINVDFGWWESTYEDAKNIGLQITGFDLDRNRGAEGRIESNTDAKEVAEKIMKEHGQSCETYKTAKNFLEECAVSDDIEYLNEEFTKNIVEDYSIILQNESDYLQSDEAIIETINANDYDFTEEGERY